MIYKNLPTTWIVIVSSLAAVLGQDNDTAPVPTLQPVVVPLPRDTGNDTTSPGYNLTCSISQKDGALFSSIARLKAENTKLIHYEFAIRDWTPRTHMATQGWARVSNLHGQTLLSMEFTHGIMSLMTLTLGQKHMRIELEDQPAGCIADLSDAARDEKILKLLLRDFGNETSAMMSSPERICKETIVVESGVAKFRNKCCGKTLDSRDYSCWMDLKNVWLTILEVVLIIVKYATLLYGPFIFVQAVVRLGSGIETLPYKVPCPDNRPLKKTIRVYKDKLPEKIPTYRHMLDVRRKVGYSKLYRSLLREQIPLGETMDVKVTQYDVSVTHDKLVTEYHVPVGFWSSVARICFRCKLNRMGPFKACLTSHMCCGWLWIDLVKRVGMVLMVLMLPLPYYIRLIVFYRFEKTEVDQRNYAAGLMGVDASYEHSLIHYMSPTHSLFIIIYLIYAITSLTIAYLMSRNNNEQCIKKILFDSFFDFRYFYWIKIWKLFVCNLVFPLKRFGCLGFLLGVFYWPLVMPFTLVVCLFYHFPTTYVMYRMIYHSIYGGLRLVSSDNKPHRYKVERQQDSSIELFHAEHWWCCCKQQATHLHFPNSHKLHTSVKPLQRGGKLTKYLVAVILCFLNMIGILLLLSECIGFVVELLAFTMMGVIVNASFLLVYVSFVFLIVIYCYDCFNNVTVSYQKLNKAIFWTLLSKLEGQICVVAGEVANKQENTGFIMEDALTKEEKQYTTQGSTHDEDGEDDHSSDEDWDWLAKERDDIDLRNGLRPEVDAETVTHVQACKTKSFWNINDLVLFMDNRDIPRIPRKLFDEVCNVRLHGLPGPLYLSHLNAFKQLVVISIFLFFVFIVIQTFGMVYNITAGNKLIATLISGFIPMILRNFLAPKPPNVDVRNMNFKTRINQILMNYNEWWPVYDFPFKKYVPSEEEELASPDDVRPNILGTEKYHQEDERASLESSEAGDHHHWTPMGGKAGLGSQSPGVRVEVEEQPGTGKRKSAAAQTAPLLPHPDLMDDGSMSMLPDHDGPEVDYIIVIDSMNYDDAERGNSVRETNV